MLNKVVSPLLIFFMLCPMIAISDPPELPPQPRITGIQKGEEAPFSGVLLNTIAAAKMFTEKDYSLQQCDLRVRYEVDKEMAKLNAIIQSQRASYESLEKKYETIITIKDREIKRISDIASNTNDYSVWWAAGGVVAGIALTLAVVYAVKAGD
jgi:hypothetical protein